MASWRARLAQRGLVRFEVMAPEADRELVRALAKCLADGGSAADEARVAVAALVGAPPPSTGGILAALRASPLVGADLDVERERTAGRVVDL